MELLLALALGMLLLAGATDTLATLINVARVSGDQAVLIERGHFAAEYFAQEVARSWPVGEPATIAPSVCEPPVPGGGRGIRIMGVSAIDCTGLTRPVAESQVLVLETVDADIRHRRLYYLRDYSWVQGDEKPALMMKEFKAELGRFGRAEMLVPGVVHWQLNEITNAGVDFELILAGSVRDVANRGVESVERLQFLSVSRALQFP